MAQETLSACSDKGVIVKRSARSVMTLRIIAEMLGVRYAIY